jgi:hypothetical protein
VRGCKGQVEHGTGCNVCGKCLAEIARIKRENRPKITDSSLTMWEAAATDPEHIEIIRLARLGLWAEKNHFEIDQALSLARRELPQTSRRAFENAQKTRPPR